MKRELIVSLCVAALSALTASMLCLGSADTENGWIYLLSGGFCGGALYVSILRIIQEY